MKSQESVALDEIIDLLRKIKKSEDLRWLSRYIAIQAGLKPDLRGIGFTKYRRSAALNKILKEVGDLTDAELMTLHKMVGLLWEALRPKSVKGRGVVEIKVISKDSIEIDFETGLPLLDEEGKVVTVTIDYEYVYIRLWAGKGDTNRKRKKLLSLYADAGMGRGGSGGYVAAALKEGLISEEEILKAFHKNLASGDPDSDIYDQFVDQCAILLAGG